jgi:hypothetical protein
MTPHIEGSAVVIGAIVGMATAVTQQSPVEMGLLGSMFSSPVGSATVSMGVALITIKTSVKIMERDLSEVRKDLKDVATRVARIEGKLEAEQ